MGKMISFLLGVSLASTAYADPTPPDTDTTSEPSDSSVRVCPDGTIVWIGQDCPLSDRDDPPPNTPYPKPHIGWDDPGR
jgi:hypothetical protein